MQRSGNAIKPAFVYPAAQQENDVGAAQIELCNSIRKSRTLSSRRSGLLSVPVMAAVGWLAVQGKIGKVPKQRSAWSFRSLTGKAVDEVSSGFWESQVWGWEDSYGAWHNGRWEVLLQQGEAEYTDKQWLAAYRMDRSTFLGLYQT